MAAAAEVFEMNNESGLLGTIPNHWWYGTSKSTLVRSLMKEMFERNRTGKCDEDDFNFITHLTGIDSRVYGQMLSRRVPTNQDRWSEY